MISPLKIKRKIALFLAFWLLFEPIFLTAATPGSTLTSKQKISTEVSPIPVNEIVPPQEYLEKLLETRGLFKEDMQDPEKIKDALETKTLNDWMMFISNSYSYMTAGDADVFSFYSTIHNLHDNGSDYKDALLSVKRIQPRMLISAFKAARKTALLGLFLGKAHNLPVIAKMLDAVKKMGFKMPSIVSKVKVFDFLNVMCAPTTAFIDDTNSITQTQAYWRWIQKVIGKAPGETTSVINNFSGIARTVGIADEILNFSMDAYYYFSSSDYAGDRFSSWDLIQTIISGGTSVAAIICMFVPGGQIVAIFSILWGPAFSQMMTLFINQHTKWRESYKNSYWFLYENDPAFKSYYQNRSLLKPDEKCASLVLAENDYGNKLKDQKPQSDSDKQILDRSLKIYEALEKQGILMSYYSSANFNEPDFDLNRLEEFWNAKANYMAWKPTEEDVQSGNSKGFWGTVLTPVNPMTYISPIKEKETTENYKKEVSQKNVKPVYFNPDFVLYRKYKSFMIGKNLKEDFYNFIELRIEQAPFNYIPLLGIVTSAWNDEVLDEAFQADSFIVGTKETAVLGAQMDAINSEIEKSLEDYEKQMTDLDKDFIPRVQKNADILLELMESARDNPDIPNPDLLKKCKSIFKQEKSTGPIEPTPRNIISSFRPQLELLLEIIPLSIGQNCTETVMYAVFAKQVKDTVKLMDSYLKEKEESLTNFDSEFKSEAFRKLLKEGTFLDNKGTSNYFGSDWFAGIYPAWEELRKNTTIFRKGVQTYEEFAQKAGSEHKTGMLWWSAKIADPKEALEEMNAQLEKFKNIISIYESLDDQKAKPILSSTNQNFFPDTGFKLFFDPNQLIDLEASDTAKDFSQ
ncbi:MAG: hypothetical protein HQM08_04245 [Candidatus Riflebacteria bacterium]|nr:hypothetical protein [Candidatus Riflebacteria bacterium]